MKLKHLFSVLSVFSIALLATSDDQKKIADDWVACGWGGGGYFWSCAYHPDNSNIIFLGGDVNGMLKSEDKGNNWRFINNGISNYGVYSIAVSKSNPDIIYIATEGGINKSVNGGENWVFLEKTGKKNLNLTINRPFSVRAIAINPKNPEIVLVGTGDGRICTSADGGETWLVTYTSDSFKDLKNNGLSTISSVSISPLQESLIFASSRKDGILRSIDSGKTWEKLINSPAMYVAPSPHDTNVVYASFDKEGLMLSNDKGNTWSQIKIESLGDAVIREIVLDPLNPMIINCIAGKSWSGFFLKTTDGGNTWHKVSQMKKNPFANPTLPLEGNNGFNSFSSLTNLAISPSNPNEMFISANWRNCYSSDGGLTWENRDRGADITCCTDLAFSQNKIYATAMDEGLLMSEDNGKNWKQLFPLKWAREHSGHQWQVEVVTVNGVDKIISTLSAWDSKTPAARLLISDDGGKTFTISINGIPEKRSNKNCMWGESYPRGLVVDPKNPNIIYFAMDGDPEPEKGVTGGGIFKSIDGGKSWAPLPSQPASRRIFYGLAICPISSSRLYVATCGDRGGLYKTEDGGNTWELIFSTQTWLFNVAVSPSGVVYTGQNSLWASTDFGKTWEKIAEFEKKHDITSIEIDKENENRIWLAKVAWNNEAVGEIWRTSDKGKTWENITGNLPVRKPMVLKYDTVNKELWVGCSGGIFKKKE